jgi:hypothetical protein
LFFFVFFNFFLSKKQQKMIFFRFPLKIVKKTENAYDSQFPGMRRLFGHIAAVAYHCVSLRIIAYLCVPFPDLRLLETEGRRGVPSLAMAVRRKPAAAEARAEWPGLGDTEDSDEDYQPEDQQEEEEGGSALDAEEEPEDEEDADGPR